MKKVFLGIVVLIAMFGLAQISSASIINGGFETDYTFTGWTKTGTGYIINSGGGFSAHEGYREAFIQSANSSTAKLSQTIDLMAGDTLAGWYGFLNTDPLANSYNYSYGKITSASGVTFSLWEEVLPKAAGGWGGGYYVSSWLDWSWKALEDGIYTLEFGVLSRSAYTSALYLDGITLTPAPPQNPVPEPATMILFGLGLLGLAGVSRKKVQE